MTRYEELKSKQKAAFIVVCTLGLAATPLIENWKNNIFEGTSFDQEALHLVFKIFSFLLTTAVIAIPAFFFYLIVLIVTSIQLIKNRPTMPTYLVHRISVNNNNLLFPDRLDIDDDKIEYYKGAIFSYSKLTIPRSQISSVSVVSGMVFADVVIESCGGRKITIKGLSKSDANNVDEILGE